MDRSIVYTQEQARSTDFLFAQRATLIGLGKLAKAMLGASTIVEGLSVSPTTPASLGVLVSSGQIYSLQPVDASAYGVLPADTTDQIVKQGLLMSAQTLSTPAPTTSGYSINYLIEATYQDSDTNPVVLPYFNSANPSQPLSGQNNSGAAQPTQRQGLCIVQVKAGAAATTGTQTTPAPDAGFVGLAVVTVSYGQTSVTSSNITPYPNAPIITNLLQMMQQASTITAPDTGTANAYAMALTPPIAAYTPGMLLSLQNIKESNTGASTLAVNGLAALPIQGPGATALQGGELVAGYGALLRVNSAATAFELIQTTGGSLPVKAATASNQAVNLGQANSLYAPVSGDAAQTFSASQFYGYSSKSFNSILSGVSSLPPNYDAAVAIDLSLSSAATGLTYNSSDNRYLNLGLGPNGPFIRTASLNLDLTNCNQVLVPNATVPNAPVNLGQANSLYAPVSGNAAQTFAVADATASNQAVTLAQLQQLGGGGNFQGWGGDLTSNTTLPNTAWGQAYQVGSSGITITLPTSNGSAGQAIWFYPTFTTGSCTINCTGSGQFIFAPTCGLGTSNTSITLNAGEWVCIFSRGSGEFDVIAGSWLNNHQTSQHVRYSGGINFSGLNSTLASLVLPNAFEYAQTIAAAPAATQTVYLNTGSVIYFTAAAANNWVLNVAFSSGTALNAALAVGQTVTLAVLVTQGATAYYPTGLQIDGTAVSPKWQGGTAPSSGDANAIDVYTYTITKTASATYTVLASATKFA